MHMGSHTHIDIRLYARACRRPDSDSGPRERVRIPAMGHGLPHPSVGRHEVHDAGVIDGVAHRFTRSVGLRKANAPVLGNGIDRGRVGRAADDGRPPPGGAGLECLKIHQSGWQSRELT